jgi:hypothetical protein
MNKTVEMPPLAADGDDWDCSFDEATSPRQARMCALERHRQVAMQLEIPWDTYKTLNGIHD